MYFTQMVKRLTIDTFLFLAALLNLTFVYLQMVPFITSAIKLDALDVQLVCYILYVFLLTLLPILLFVHNLRFSKKRALKWLFYMFAAVIFVGTAADMIKYDWFNGYSFSEGDAVFVNIMWNMPNKLGAAVSVVVAGLYKFLGDNICSRRRKSYILYVIIAIVSSFVPFIYTLSATGYLPRQTYMEKQAMLVPEYWLIAVALTICVTSRRMWLRQLWDR